MNLVQPVAGSAGVSPAQRAQRAQTFPRTRIATLLDNARASIFMEAPLRVATVDIVASTLLECGDLSPLS
jgi:hypothetical protein